MGRTWVWVVGVIGGYVFAVAMALGAVWFNSLFMTQADRIASSGMTAFADVMLFILVFGFFSIFSTGAAVFFLWRKWKMRGSEK